MNIFHTSSSPLTNCHSQSSNTRDSVTVRGYSIIDISFVSKVCGFMKVRRGSNDSRIVRFKVCVSHLFQNALHCMPYLLVQKHRCNLATKLGERGAM